MTDLSPPRFRPGARLSEPQDLPFDGVHLKELTHSHTVAAVLQWMESTPIKLELLTWHNVFYVRHGRGDWFDDRFAEADNEPLRFIDALQATLKAALSKEVDGHALRTLWEDDDHDKKSLDELWCSAAWRIVMADLCTKTSIFKDHCNDRFVHWTFRMGFSILLTVYEDIRENRPNGYFCKLLRGAEANSVFRAPNAPPKRAADLIFKYLDPQASKRRSASLPQSSEFQQHTPGSDTPSSASGWVAVNDPQAKKHKRRRTKLCIPAMSSPSPDLFVDGDSQATINHANAASNDTQPRVPDADAENSYFDAQAAREALTSADGWIMTVNQHVMMAQQNISDANQHITNAAALVSSQDVTIAGLRARLERRANAEKKIIDDAAAVVKYWTPMHLTGFGKAGKVIQKLKDSLKEYEKT